MNEFSKGSFGIVEEAMSLQMTFSTLNRPE
jgi:hypothetical protein